MQSSITADELWLSGSRPLCDQNFLLSYPLYKNILYFQADFVLIKMVLYLQNFSLMFLIHVFLHSTDDQRYQHPSLFLTVIQLFH